MFKQTYGFQPDNEKEALMLLQISITNPCRVQSLSHFLGRGQDWTKAFAAWLLFHADWRQTLSGDESSLNPTRHLGHWNRSLQTHWTEEGPRTQKHQTYVFLKINKHKAFRRESSQGKPQLDFSRSENTWKIVKRLLLIPKTFAKWLNLFRPLGYSRSSMDAPVHPQTIPAANNTCKQIKET